MNHQRGGHSPQLFDKKNASQKTCCLVVGQFNPMWCKAAMSGDFKRPPKPTHSCVTCPLFLVG